MSWTEAGDYPRPDFRREFWRSLDGEWNFDFDDAARGEELGWDREEGQLSQTIRVPFAYQTPASGVGITQRHDVVWYRRTFDLDESLRGKRIFLHFGAVDWEAAVYLNGRMLGTHVGGYTPFYFEITRWVRETGNLLCVKAIDRSDPAQPRGKQYWEDQPEGCWYTPTTGIWQSVWLEGIAGTAIRRLGLTPDARRAQVEIEVETDDFQAADEARIELRYRGKMIARLCRSVERRTLRAVVPIPAENPLCGPHFWSPESPNLYDISVSLRAGGRETDRVESYFGLREISTEGGRVLLNGRPYYLKMVLDQGYWAQSGLTPPSGEALRRDVELTKRYGFNGARKHQKIEDPRYYYWCDVLGLLVWGELPSAYEFGDAAANRLIAVLQGFLERDRSHPCLMAWVLLNESWGVPQIGEDMRQQQLARTLFHLCKTLDPTRLVSVNDGWELIEGDLACVHDYAATGAELEAHFAPAAMERREGLYPAGRRLYARGNYYRGEPMILSEYGGIALAAQTENGAWGYAGAEPDVDALVRRYADVTGAARKLSCFCGYCYTQLTDAYQEVNGLLNADHTVKAPPEAIAALNA